MAVVVYIKVTVLINLLALLESLAFYLNLNDLFAIVVAVVASFY
jgi:hypothetical protein